MAAPTVVILAAGEGTRMRSATPKVLHEVCGRPMVLWPVAAALAAGASKVVVVGGPDRALEGHLPEGVELVVQQQALGTGDAVKSAAPHIDRDAPVIILAGDVPLITAEAIAGLAEAHEALGAAATMATMDLDDPTGYGRVVRGAGGSVERVVETKTDGDATEEELEIAEVNTGVFAFDGGALVDALESVQADNAQGEYYLPDVLVVLREGGSAVAAYEIDEPTQMLGVNDRSDLAEVTMFAQARILRMHMLEGVTIVDPDSTTIDADVSLGRDTVLEPGCSLRGATSAGERCRIGPHSTLIDCELADEVTIPHSYGVQATLGPRATAGPFAYLRPGAALGEGAKAGTFVEIKNSNIGAGTKIPHLSYIGDADVGEGSNLGAGTITANYDGRNKHRTRIGKRVKGGVDTAFVAPVEVGDDAWTAAGSVITEDIPPGALGVARSKQRNVQDYSDRERGE